MQKKCKAEFPRNLRTWLTLFCEKILLFSFLRSTSMQRLLKYFWEMYIIQMQKFAQRCQRYVRHQYDSKASRMFRTLQNLEFYGDIEDHKTSSKQIFGLNQLLTLKLDGSWAKFCELQISPWTLNIFESMVFLFCRNIALDIFLLLFLVLISTKINF